MLKAIISGVLRSMGRELISTEALERLQLKGDDLAAAQTQLREYKFLKTLSPMAAAKVLELLPDSHAQFRQDLFVLTECDFKVGGFFVEFGATNGRDLSNTWLLESRFGWTGLLAEPAVTWHSALAQNRRCAIDKRCVWSQSGQVLSFAEVSAAELSTIESFTDVDMHRTSRSHRKQYAVQTISLFDLLREHRAPTEIDYLSLDTEGSELDILSAFDFDSYRFRLITVEHNFTPAREKLNKLLELNGYVRKLEAVSHVDDWYVHRDYLAFQAK